MIFSRLNIELSLLLSFKIVQNAKERSVIPPSCLTLKRLIFTAMTVFSCALSLPRSSYADDSKTKDIMLLIEVSGQKALSEQMISLITPQFLNALKASSPDLPADKLSKLFTYLEAEMKKEVPSLLIALVPVYDEHYIHEEIKGLIEFYQSPLGQIFVKKQGPITAAGSKVGEKWGMRVAQEAMQGAMKLLK